LRSVNAPAITRFHANLQLLWDERIHGRDGFPSWRAQSTCHIYPQYLSAYLVLVLEKGGGGALIDQQRKLKKDR
jgi:hypothetical protein